MSRESAQAWFRDQPVDPPEAIASALAVLKRNGWTAASLDYLLYEGLGDDEVSNGDEEFDGALEVLGRAREAGYPLA